MKLEYGVSEGSVVQFSIFHLGVFFIFYVNSLFIYQIKFIVVIPRETWTSG